MIRLIPLQFVTVFAVLIVAPTSALASGETVEGNPLANPEKLYSEKMLSPEIQRVLRLVPKETTDVFEPPARSQVLQLDSIEVRLPLGSRWKAFHTNTVPNLLVLSAFGKTTNRFSLSNIGPNPQYDVPYPPLSFDEMNDVLNTTPDSLARAGDRNRKREVVLRLLAKAAFPSKYLSKWEVVKTPTLLAIIQRSLKFGDGFRSAQLSVWSRNGSAYLQVVVVGKDDPQLAQRILGGIKFKRDSVSPAQVQKDIDQLLLDQSADAKTSMSTEKRSVRNSVSK